MEALEPSPSDTVLEIGPGRGALTLLLAGRVGRLIAVEKDRRLAGELAEALAARFGRNGRWKVEVEDILRWDWSRLPAGARVIGNLPYEISTPVLEKLFGSDRWSVAVLMLQREFAVRLAASPGGKEYGRLSLFARCFCACETVREVPASCFRPRPRVDSRIVRLTRRSPPLVAQERQPEFFAVVASAFGRRRKTLLNSIAAGLKVPKPEVDSVLRSAGIDPRRRAETLDLEEFRRIAESLAARDSIHRALRDYRLPVQACC